MHTFLAIAGSPGAARTLASFPDRLRCGVPFAGDEHTEITELPELLGGFVTIASQPARRRFESWSDGALRVLFFGELLGVKDGLRAALAAERFLRGGAAAAAALNGSFAAVFFELDAFRVSLVSDAIGARALRYCDGATLLVSPHDLSLAWRIRSAAS